MNNSLILTAQQFQAVKGTPSKLIQFDSIQKNLTAKERVKLELNGASDLTAHAYTLRVEVSHDNGGALTVDTFQFWSNIINEISLQLGTGNDIFELGIRECFYRQLKNRQRVASTIDKTTGSGKTSTLTLIIDLLSIGYLSPRDTALYVDNYKQKNIYVKGGDFSSVANCTVNTVAMKLKEQFTQNANPITRKNTDGTASIINAVRRPVIEMKEMSGASNSFEIAFPENERTTEAYIYVIDGNGDLVSGTITDVAIKNSHTNIYSDTFAEIQEQNQIDIFSVSNSLFNDVAWLNIAGGKYSRAINTSLAREKNTKLVMKVNPQGADDLNVVVLFETVR